MLRNKAGNLIELLQLIQPLCEEDRQWLLIHK